MPQAARPPRSKKLTTCTVCWREIGVADYGSTHDYRNWKIGRHMDLTGQWCTNSRVTVHENLIFEK